eukprot:CAMPEP_0119073628 /NCGR_PEP_ID=MMETSP1178-20130426/67388_1 /TAXON_ID=33656 /ORGANISM="unid sp, Strain CCMP2000" /LENGTH=55 /DNA_ID=CAMNT_0007055725 /DNA_START=353 /DNA_END=517 /DNA_ORIENTATION=-
MVCRPPPAFATGFCTLTNAASAEVHLAAFESSASLVSASRAQVAECRARRVLHAR